MILTKIKTLTLEVFNEHTEVNTTVEIDVELTLEEDQGDYYTPPYRSVTITDVMTNDIDVDGEEVSYADFRNQFLVYQYDRLTKGFHLVSIDDYFNHLESKGAFDEEAFDDEYYDTEF